MIEAIIAVTSMVIDFKAIPRFYKDETNEEAAINDK